MNKFSMAIIICLAENITKEVYILSCTLIYVVYVGPPNCFVSSTFLRYKKTLFIMLFCKDNIFALEGPLILIVGPSLILSFYKDHLVVLYGPPLILLS